MPFAHTRICLFLFKASSSEAGRSTATTSSTLATTSTYQHGSPFDSDVKIPTGMSVTAALAQVHARMEEIDARGAEARAAKILDGLQFTSEDMQQATRTFSGGWRMRLALARAMLQKADLLLLDEPTNHLDVGAVEWLASHLNSLAHTTVLVVSHDYDFLADVATNIVHFEDQTLTAFEGGFAGFRREKPNLVLPRMKKHLVDEIEKRAAADGVAAVGHGHDASNAGERSSKMRSAALAGVSLEDLGTRASARGEQAASHQTASAAIRRSDVRALLRRRHRLRHHGG